VRGPERERERERDSKKSTTHNEKLLNPKPLTQGHDSKSKRGGESRHNQKGRKKKSKKHNEKLLSRSAHLPNLFRV